MPPNFFGDLGAFFLGKPLFFGIYAGLTVACQHGTICIFYVIGSGTMKRLLWILAVCLALSGCRMTLLPEPTEAVVYETFGTRPVETSS
jgi:hypothetical protein